MHLMRILLLAALLPLTSTSVARATEDRPYDWVFNSDAISEHLHMAPFLVRDILCDEQDDFTASEHEIALVTAYLTETDVPTHGVGLLAPLVHRGSCGLKADPNLADRLYRLGAIAQAPHILHQMRWQALGKKAPETNPLQPRSMDERLRYDVYTEKLSPAELGSLTLERLFGSGLHPKIAHRIAKRLVELKDAPPTMFTLLADALKTGTLWIDDKGAFHFDAEGGPKSNFLSLLYHMEGLFRAESKSDFLRYIRDHILTETWQDTSPAFNNTITDYKLFLTPDWLYILSDMYLDQNRQHALDIAACLYMPELNKRIANASILGRLLFHAQPRASIDAFFHLWAELSEAERKSVDHLINSKGRGYLGIPGRFDKETNIERCITVLDKSDDERDLHSSLDTIGVAFSAIDAMSFVKAQSSLPKGSGNSARL